MQSKHGGKIDESDVLIRLAQNETPQKTGVQTSSTCGISVYLESSL